MPANVLQYVSGNGYEDLIRVQLHERLPFKGNARQSRTDSELAIVSTTNGNRYVVPVRDLFQVEKGESYWVNVNLDGAEGMVPFRNGMTGQVIRIRASTVVKSALRKTDGNHVQKRVRECGVLKEVDGAFCFMM